MRKLKIDYYWKDNIDSYICPFCGYETGYLTKECPHCHRNMVKQKSDALTGEIKWSDTAHNLQVKETKIKRGDIYADKDSGEFVIITWVADKPSLNVYDINGLMEDGSVGAWYNWQFLNYITSGREVYIGRVDLDGLLDDVASVRDEYVRKNI